MITPEYCQTMACYNAWQNKSVMACLRELDDKALRKDRKAFFGSIFATANHVLWGDKLWMSRFDKSPPPDCPPKDHATLHKELQPYLDDRLMTDAHIIRWADGLNQIDLVGPLDWYSDLSKRSMSKPIAMCITHFFNHQTHHRGQIHAMLTAAGAKPDDTDIVFMLEPD